DIATIFDTALGIFSLTLFFRNYFTYFIYVTLIALKVIAGFALSITFFVISGLGDFLNSTATLWIAGLTIFWLGFYVALRRPNVKEWYRAGSNNKPQPSAQSAG
ncbi:MAG: hypothetical protein SVR94_09645, partial [Pseudomonadota bacterium]|nr:hypothetical protein [Pseudomonadota bacterium]